MKNLSKIRPTDITLGEPLRFSVYDKNGVLLLRRGFVITIPAQIERLLNDGIFQDLNEPAANDSAGGGGPVRPASSGFVPPREKLPTFLSGEMICNKVKSLYAAILRTPDQANAMEKGLEIAELIQRACTDDADSLVAALHIDIASPYLLVHQSLGGVLTELTARQAEIDPAARKILVAAAVTRDLGQTLIQGELDRHQGPLTPELRAKVESHPLKTSELLAAAGVTDKIWLDAVAGHHERLDGSGYPKRLAGDQISRGARILAVCDVYSAMVKPRPYRQNGKANFTQSALRELYASSGNTLANDYATLLIRAIGVLPAGSIVKLQNGEIAMVKQGSSTPNNMTVHSIYDKEQMPLMVPVLRRTAEPGFAITGMAHYLDCRSANLTIRRLWIKGA